MRPSSSQRYQCACDGGVRRGRAASVIFRLISDRLRRNGDAPVVELHAVLDRRGPPQLRWRVAFGLDKIDPCRPRRTPFVDRGVGTEVDRCMPARLLRLMLHAAHACCMLHAAHCRLECCRMYASSCMSAHRFRPDASYLPAPSSRDCSPPFAALFPARHVSIRSTGAHGTAAVAPNLPSFLCCVALLGELRPVRCGGRRRRWRHRPPTPPRRSSSVAGGVGACEGMAIPQTRRPGFVPPQFRRGPTPLGSFRGRTPQGHVVLLMLIAARVCVKQ